MSLGASGEESASAKPNPKPMIGAYYFDGWSGKSEHAGNPKEPWAKNAPTHLSRRMVEEFPQREPVWGWRNDSMEVMERQITLAADHGLGFFSFCWYWHDNALAINKKAIKEDPKHTSLDLFVKARNNHRMKFCLLVANHPGYEIKAAENWKAAVEAWMPYLKHKQYLTVGGRPLVILFEPAGVDQEALAVMQDTARKAGLAGLAIAGCGGGSSDIGFTHRTHYNVAPGGASGSVAHKYSELVAANQAQWKGRAEQPYIPIVTAGWDKRPWEGPTGLYNQPAGWYYPDRTPEQFADFLRGAIRWMDKHPEQTTAERLVLIYAWNEFGEGGYVAPTKGDAEGKYLIALQSVVAPLVKAAATSAAIAPPGDYSFSLWLNGWPKVQADFAWMRSPKGSPFVYPRWEDWPRNRSDLKLPWHFTPPTARSVFAVATSRYEFTVDPSDFGKAGFARVSKPAHGYAEAAREDTADLHRLPAADVIVELQMGGRTFRAAGTSGAARMWESGRFVQRYDFPDLELEGVAGERLLCDATLELVAWPDSLTLTARLAPHKKDGKSARAASAPADKNAKPAPQWGHAKLRVGIRGEGIDCIAEQAMNGQWKAGEEKSVTATFRAGPRAAAGELSLAVSSGTDQKFPAKFEPSKDCFVAFVPKLKRAFRGSYADIREYDEFRLAIDNRGTARADVPFLLECHDVASPTGLVPMLCDAAGRPTGIPVQLSKNWHQGTYLMAYAMLPAPPGRTEYILRLVYGFYGNVPSASHAQLSLIGWGGYGRWDQLAIGCWGETFCLDMDMTNLRTVIADVRTLMVRRGRDGKKWGWSDAQWGGDWLGLADAAGKRLAFGDLKTAYVAHGPCLSDVRYAGQYGPGRDVAFQAQVHTLRTDDYARTFHNLKYTFGREAKVEGSWLFRMGGGVVGYTTPTIAYGNEKGLIAEHKPPATLKPRDVIADRVTLGGKGPWWVAFPDANVSPSGLPTGARALIIRSYKATFGGKEHAAPTITLLVNRATAEGLNIDLILVPPKDVATFRTGDTVEMAVEWITLPRVEEDYYGPNESFRKHLAASGTSWKTTYREAAGNDLAVTARGGKVLHRYPVIIHADGPTVEVSIKGGVGYVPIRFEGIKSIDGIGLYEVVGGKELKLDQIVHGDDFWQTDYDAATKTYSLTYNLPLDNKPQSTWRLH
ncbi:MAG: glycoside hydrolase family 99-like domain-containing protein [Planctomycetaceae bacterium]|nr:glycoside hydrolase family 99-like domain-containing protein [Planctomycetaceae bacterium]